MRKTYVVLMVISFMIYLGIFGASIALVILKGVGVVDQSWGITLLPLVLILALSFLSAFLMGGGLYLLVFLGASLKKLKKVQQEQREHGRSNLN